MWRQKWRKMKYWSRFEIILKGNETIYLLLFQSKVINVFWKLLKYFSIRNSKSVKDVIVSLVETWTILHRKLMKYFIKRKQFLAKLLPLLSVNSLLYLTFSFSTLVITQQTEFFQDITTQHPVYQGADVVRFRC